VRCGDKIGEHINRFSPLGKYAGLQSKELDPDVQTRGDTKEGYYICRDLDANELEYPLHGPNVWPDEQAFPRFRTVMERYHGLMTALSFRVARLFAAAAGQPGAFDKPGMFDKPMAALRLLHYDAVRSNVDAGIFGCGAHTDYGLLTLLSTDATPGLQILMNHVWINVPPCCASVNGGKTAFIVNIGDMGERWSNGRFPSTTHRVVNMDGKERWSVPFFYEPNFTCRVECFASCVSDEKPAQYAPTTSGQHLLSRYRATHASFDS